MQWSSREREGCFNDREPSGLQMRADPGIARCENRNLLIFKAEGKKKDVPPRDGAGGTGRLPEVLR